MVIMLAMVFLIPLVSADTWDNCKVYNEATQTVTIKNAFCLGKDLANITLDTPLNNRVIAGQDIKVAKMTIKNFDDHGDDIFEEMSFYHLPNLDAFSRNFEYKRKEIEVVDKYKTECSQTTLANNSIKTECERVKDGTKEIDKWVTLDKEFTLGEGEEIELGLFTQVKVGDRVEWIPNILGEKVDEWAEWTADLNIGLIDYYRFDSADASTTAIDAVRGLANGTYTGARNQDYAKIGQSVYFDGANDKILFDGLSNIPSDFNLGSTFSTAYWFSANTTSGAMTVGTIGACGGDQYNYWSANKFQIAYAGEYDFPSSVFTPTLGQWYHVAVVSAGGSNKTLYIDGSRHGTFSNSGAWDLECYMENGGSMGFSMGEEENGGNDWHGYLDEMGIWNRTITQAEITQLYNGGAGITYTTEFGEAPTVTLNAPADNHKSRTGNITFNCSATDASANPGILNLTLLLDDVVNITITNSSAASNLSLESLRTGFTEGSHNWTCKSSDSTAQTIAVARDFTVDTTLPLITITAPEDKVNDFIWTGKSVNLNWTINDTNLESCWFEYNGSNTTLTCSANHTTFAIASGVYELTLYANDTHGNENSAFRNWSYRVFENSRNFTTPMYETANNSFQINISTDGSQTITAVLDYAGTEYVGAKNGTDSNAQFTASFDTPIGVTSNTFFWNISYGGTYIATNSTSQSISLFNVSQCSNPVSTSPKMIHFTARDEVSDDPINWSLANFDGTFYLGTGAINRTISSYTNTTANVSFYDFCATPKDFGEIKQDFTIRYSATDYPQRTFATATPIGFNGVDIITLNQTLYLLSTADGGDVTLQVQSASGSPLENVYVNVTRGIGGVKTLVGSGNTGSDGGITFFLNGDEDHTFTFVKSGFPTLVTTFQPTQTTYTITMGELGGNETFDCARGVNFHITPRLNVLNNNTNYTFGFNLTSAYWEVSEFGFTIKNGTSSTIAGNRSTVNGGNLTLVINTGSNSSLLMEYFWAVGAGNYSNSTRSWMVINDENFGFGLKTFFDDLKSYTADDGTGIFGLSNIGLFLIIFTLIFLMVGGLAMTTGLYSPMALVVQTWLLVFLFDVVFGVFPNPNPDIMSRGVPTIIVGIIAVAIYLRENMR